MPSEREAKKERNDFVDPILKANEETTPIPNYFAPAIVLDVVQLKFIGASVLTLFALADTLYRSKVKIYHSSTLTYTAKKANSYSQACRSLTLKITRSTMTKKKIS
uniref:Uncharacterized protein n=1 Tax=Lepeophtheirus salmonis TaxID=72036 RepID=A0A0K2VAP5_LEPSM